MKRLAMSGLLVEAWLTVDVLVTCGRRATADETESATDVQAEDALWAGGALPDEGWGSVGSRGRRAERRVDREDGWRLPDLEPLQSLAAIAADQRLPLRSFDRVHRAWSPGVFLLHQQDPIRLILRW